MGVGFNLALIVIGTIFIAVGAFGEPSALIIGALIWGFLLLKGVMIYYLD